MQPGRALAALTVAAVAVAACRAGRLAPLPACAPSAATARARLEILARPFAGEHVVSNMFDHDVPLPLADRNDHQLITCGQRIAGVRGHDGYDWRMPVGTPLLAAAEGRIVVAGEEPAGRCALLGKTVAGARIVTIETRPTPTDVYRAIYGHLDRIDVQVGDTVHVGDVVGTSGSTGCSLTPHLHFSVARVLDGGRQVMVDPYGWHADAPDPWAGDARGTTSRWLWRPAASPRLFR